MDLLSQTAKERTYEIKHVVDNTVGTFWPCRGTCIQIALWQMSHSTLASCIYHFHAASKAIIAVTKYEAS